jgi:hypothetical protein
MQLLSLAVMAAADIVSGARYGLLGAIIAAWPAVAFFGAADMVLELAHRSPSRRREAGPATALAVPSEVRQAVRAAYRGLSDNGTVVVVKVPRRARLATLTVPMSLVPGRQKTGRNRGGQAAPTTSRCCLR